MVRISNIRMLLTILIFFCLALPSSLIKAKDNNNSSEKLNNNSAAYYSGYGKKVPITGNVSELKNFFDALSTTKQDKIRIAHYGDSVIWGDIITDDLRQDFQDKFGGHGAGIQSVCSDDIKVKETTKHTFSDNWKWNSLFTSNIENFPIGIAATSATPKGNSAWIKYEATNFRESSNSFKIAKLFYNNVNAGASIKYSFNNGPEQTAKLKAGKNLQEFEMNSSGSARSLKITFENCQGGYFYAVSLEDGNGVYVDNFPLRGNSGASLLDFNEDLMKDFNKKLNYKLIILNYGLNIASAEQTNYEWYKHKMIRVVKSFQKNFPDASILFMGVGDRSIKKGSRFVSDPAVERLISVQKEIAEKTNVAFWNLFEAMGGKNSMTDWVQARPALGYVDYSHYTPEGGKLVADLLTEALMDAYKNSH